MSKYDSFISDIDVFASRFRYEDNLMPGNKIKAVISNISALSVCVGVCARVCV